MEIAPQMNLILTVTLQQVQMPQMLPRLRPREAASPQVVLRLESPACFLSKPGVSPTHPVHSLEDFQHHGAPPWLMLMEIQFLEIGVTAL